MNLKLEASKILLLNSILESNVIVLNDCLGSIPQTKTSYADGNIKFVKWVGKPYQ